MGLVDAVGNAHTGAAGAMKRAEDIAESHADKGRNHELYRVAKARLLGAKYSAILADVEYRNPAGASRL